MGALCWPGAASTTASTCTLVTRDWFAPFVRDRAGSVVGDLLADGDIFVASPAGVRAFRGDDGHGFSPGQFVGLNVRVVCFDAQ